MLGSDHRTQRWRNSLGLPEGRIQAAMFALEANGVVLRGRFTPGRRDETRNGANVGSWRAFIG